MRKYFPGDQGSAGLRFHRAAGHQRGRGRAVISPDPPLIPWWVSRRPLATGSRFLPHRLAAFFSPEQPNLLNSFSGHAGGAAGRRGGEEGGVQTTGGVQVTWSPPFLVEFLLEDQNSTNDKNRDYFIEVQVWNYGENLINWTQLTLSTRRTRRRRRRTQPSNSVN